MKEYISVGKNVDVAINDGLRTLGLNREDVDIKILETGGLFKKAKVCLIYEDIPVIVETTVEEVKEVVEQPTEIEKTEQIEEVKSVITEIVEEIKTEQPKTEQIKEGKEIKSPDELIERVKNFLVNLASKMKMEVSVEYSIENNDISFNVTGANVGKLIGYRGDTLNAIQILLGGLKRAGEGRYRLYLDVEGYKKGREQTLIDLANRMADKAEEIERNVHLDPMNAYERRIIHSALQGRTLVETESMGEGDNRHVVIKFKR
ncbi:MAG: KH domain-containing protein [Clostridia bacterium]|nr:KH domain-containing protein [Clostridia bacterium]